MILQYIIIGVILALAVAYAVYKIKTAVDNSDNPCKRCDGCAFRDRATGCKNDKECCNGIR